MGPRASAKLEVASTASKTPHLGVVCCSCLFALGINCPYHLELSQRVPPPSAPPPQDQKTTKIMVVRLPVELSEPFWALRSSLVPWWPICSTPKNTRNRPLRFQLAPNQHLPLLPLPPLLPLRLLLLLLRSPFPPLERRSTRLSMRKPSPSPASLSSSSL